MTAVMERLADAPLTRPADDTLAELRTMLAAQARTLAEQHRMLAALDARREQFDDLVEDMVPVANAAMLMATRHLEAATAPEMRAQLHEVMAQVDRVRRAPAPGLVALLRRLRDPEVRKGLALALALLGATGRVASAPASDGATGTTEP